MPYVPEEKKLGQCHTCGAAYTGNRKKVYCSARCRARAQRDRQKDRRRAIAEETSTMTTWETYDVTLTDGQRFQMRADLVQASAPLSANFHGGEDDWQGTPYQTADARHDAHLAAQLVAEYFRDGPDDCVDVASVEAR